MDPSNYMTAYQHQNMPMRKIIPPTPVQMRPFKNGTFCNNPNGTKNVYYKALCPSYNSLPPQWE